MTHTVADRHARPAAPSHVTVNGRTFTLYHFRESEARGPCKTMIVDTGKTDEDALWRRIVVNRGGPRPRAYRTALEAVRAMDALTPGLGPAAHTVMAGVLGAFADMRRGVWAGTDVPYSYATVDARDWADKVRAMRDAWPR